MKLAWTYLNSQRLKHFVSWLCLSPNKKVSGGKVLSSKTRKSKAKLRTSFKQAAIGLAKVKDNVLARFYHRMASRHGKGTAITATARKLAIIVYNMVHKRQAYRSESLVEQEQKVRTRKIKHIQRTIQKLKIRSSRSSF